MKSLRISKKVAKELDLLDPFTKRKLGDLFSLLMEGVNLGLPVSRPMPIISHGVHELRLKDKNGQFRIFYFLKAKDFVLVFHLFKKKSQAMPIKEIQVARMRLKEML